MWRLFQAPIVDDRLLVSIHKRIAAHERVLLPAHPSAAPQRSRRWLVCSDASRRRRRHFDFVDHECGKRGERRRCTRIHTRTNPDGCHCRAISRRGSLRERGSRRAPRALPYRVGRAVSAHVAARTVATLARDSRGDYRGSLRIPDSVVFAAFSVEDEPGVLVDDNAHQLWYLMRRAPDGRPLSTRWSSAPTICSARISSYRCA